MVDQVAGEFYPARLVADLGIGRGLCLLMGGVIGGRMGCGGCIGGRLGARYWPSKDEVFTPAGSDFRAFGCPPARVFIVAVVGLFRRRRDDHSPGPTRHDAINALVQKRVGGRVIGVVFRGLVTL